MSPPTAPGTKDESVWVRSATAWASWVLVTAIPRWAISCSSAVKNTQLVSQAAASSRDALASLSGSVVARYSSRSSTAYSTPATSAAAGGDDPHADADRETTTAQAAAMGRIRLTKPEP